MSKSELRKEYESRFGVVEGSLRLYDDKGNEIYCETSKGWWSKGQYDADGNQIYCETSCGLWTKCEYDDDGNKIYYESEKEGVVFDNRSCSDKVFIDEQTGKKFKLTEVK